jgi:sulfoxide reductase heme-binding subunit YedZ
MKKWTGLHIGMHVFALLPLAILVWAYFTNNLTVNPIQAAEQRLGDTALVMLILSLACTPVNTLFGFPEAIRLRRPLGLYAFFYATLHILAYVGWDYSFHFREVGSQLIGKPYLIVGMTALAILVPLAITSHDYWKKRLGKGWKRLHRFVYLSATLAVLHLALIIKGSLFRLAGDIAKPLSAGIVLLVLLFMRIPPIRRLLSNVRFLRRSRRIIKREQKNINYTNSDNAPPAPGDSN